MTLGWQRCGSASRTHWRCRSEDDTLRGGWLRKRGKDARLVPQALPAVVAHRCNGSRTDEAAAQVKPILYIAGPMSGLADSNYPEFFRVENELRAAGFDRILNPARAICPPGSSRQTYMRSVLTQLFQCDGVALLDGWWASRGAKFEVDVADRLGMEVQMWSLWVERAAS